MKIIAKIAPNNQISIQRLREYRQSKATDKSDCRNLERVACALEDYIEARSTVELIPYLTSEFVDCDRDGRKQQCVGVYDELTGKAHWESIAALQKDYDSSSLLLDIRKKSQETSSGKNTWGEYRGNYSFSKRGRSQMLRAGGVIEKKGLRDRSYAVTVTIPGGGREVHDTVARWSGWIVNRMTQLLRDSKKKLDDSDSLGYFYVWELQDRGALHMHWCLVGYPEETAHQLKDLWYLLLRELGDIEGRDLFQREEGGSWEDVPDVWQWNVQKIRQSVAGYFAKYCSKQAKASRKTNESSDLGYSQQVSPGRWYGISNSIREWVRESSVEITVIVANEEQESDWINRIMSCLHGCEVVSAINWRTCGRGAFPQRRRCMATYAGAVGKENVGMGLS